MYFFNPLVPSRAIVSGVFATGNKLARALLTLTSVACAERMTATSNSNGVEYFNSVVGFGSADCNLENTADLLFLFKMVNFVQLFLNWFAQTNNSTAPV